MFICVLKKHPTNKLQLLQHLLTLRNSLQNIFLATKAQKYCYLLVYELWIGKFLTKGGLEARSTKHEARRQKHEDRSKKVEVHCHTESIRSVVIPNLIRNPMVLFR